MLFHGVDGSVDGGESHITHLTHEVDCCVKQNASGTKETKSRSVLYGSVISNEGKEVSGGDDDCLDNHFD
eukprot:7715492-Ditylum_brightwellii.AAC.1